MSEANSASDPSLKHWNDGHNSAMEMMKLIVAQRDARIEELEAELLDINAKINRGHFDPC